MVVCCLDVWKGVGEPSAGRRRTRIGQCGLGGMQMLSVIDVSMCSCLWTIASALFCTGFSLFVGVLDSADLREDAGVFWG